ncbi:MAG: DEAD/DEAH box helicase [Snowella sp.]|nr:DEAD/DEAH box helicase [Snowella sp.]
MANYSTIWQGMLMFVNAGCGLNGKMGKDGFGFFGTTTSYTHITSIKTENIWVYRLSYSNLTLCNQAQHLGHHGDHAHRIGQKRPVTIYRLVAKSTIEEKIVDLHYQKCDLADSLLESTDVSGKVLTDQLLQLISGN